jgi:hypothetical protein
VSVTMTIRVRDDCQWEFEEADALEGAVVTLREGGSERELAVASARRLDAETMECEFEVVGGLDLGDARRAALLAEARSVEEMAHDEQYLGGQALAEMVLEVLS